MQPTSFIKGQPCQPFIYNDKIRRGIVEEVRTDLEQITLKHDDGTYKSYKFNKMTPM